MRNLLLLPDAGRQPDSLTGLVNALPGEITPWLVNLTGQSLDGQLRTVESMLDKHELRDVDVIAFGTGAAVAVRLAARQPHRIGRLVLVSPLLHADEKRVAAARRALKVLPGFLLRRRGVDKQEALARLEEDPAAELAGVRAPTLVLADAATRGQAERTLAGLSDGELRDIGDATGPWWENDPSRLVAELNR
ncbi:alpha/beta fold hydrolase [Corynebacterium guangdongense]|uniref:Pimeloyl-ACP methyl ester carboxylesterase n=1 Tax=Corynebacterium guangdongense TaxID=1783348 RepID=A0ABU1ZZG7_9CORY|nr:alpha/beta fold hydrolase [Corynebacterium guangdongense]MDR7330332.1 pimeloyl-ACP methyl ester carboxylesterase [Corynebacterium guangdongense]WJZ18890.1 Alpha/beta hydrolase family protein [Corynebacterium guangdongense]